MPRFALPLCVLAIACGSGGGGGSQDDATVFVFRLRGESPAQDFRIRSDDVRFRAQARAQLALAEASRRLAPRGSVHRGDGSHNGPWSWHLAAPELAEAHAEGCDGRPAEVERNVPYWADRLGFFCPWTAYVLREEA